MMNRWKMAVAPAAALGLASLLPAQQEVVKDVRVEILRSGGAGGGVAATATHPATFEFIAAEPAAMFGKAVAGAPYSGEGFSEVVQTLADGTRIARKHSRKVWRDGKGRTREESTLPSLGPWASAQGEVKLVTITDPVAEVSYTLNERDKTAVKRKIPNFEKLMAGAKDGKGNVMYQSSERREVVVRSSGTAEAGAKDDVLFHSAAPVAVAGPAVRHLQMIRGGAGGKEEPLGTQTMEGLKVEGKRETHTIPAGEIGNDRAIVSVTERWMSPELQVTVRSLTKDPQMGESTYRLTNISRAEPAASLFQVPADYTVKEANQQIRIEHFTDKK